MATDPVATAEPTQQAIPAEQPLVETEIPQETAQAESEPKSEEASPDVAALEIWPVMCHFEEPIATGFFDAAKLGIDEPGLRALSGLLRHMETNRDDAVRGAERMRYIVLAYAADHINKGLPDTYKPILEAQEKGDTQEFNKLANAVNAWRLWKGTTWHAFGQGLDPSETDEVKAMNDLLERVRTAKDVASQKELIAEMQTRHTAFATKIGLIKDPSAPPKPKATELYGTWTVVSAERDGKPNDKQIGKQWVIDAEKLHMASLDPARPGIDLTYEADPTTLPKSIDLSLTSSKGTIKGIYEVDGTKLKLCWWSRVRKTEFTSEDKRDLYVLERAE